MVTESDLTVVIVNYNTCELTAQCIDSIWANEPRSSFEVIVVDNGSSDGSADWLAPRYPLIRLLRSTRNLGVAGGNNLGIRAAGGRYVLLLNSDALIRAGSIDRAISFLETYSNAAGVGGNLLNQNGTFQASFVDFPGLSQELLIITKLGRFLRPWYPAHGPYAEPREVDWMSTAFMVFRKDALVQVGLVDETFFMYSDETDLQYRLRQAGWKIHYLPDINTIHLGGRSATPWRRRQMVYRGKLLFFRKHYGAMRTLILRAVLATASVSKIPLWVLLWPVPRLRERAGHEVTSNLGIVHVCLKLDAKVT